MEDQDSAIPGPEEPLYAFSLKLQNSHISCTLMAKVTDLSRGTEEIQGGEDPGGAEVNVVPKASLETKDPQERL